jgi:VanZ family protein
MARRIFLWAPPVIYMMTIFTLSAQSQPLPQVTRVIWDKALHTVEYGGLALLFYRAFAGEGLSWRSAFMLAFVATSLYGATDEWHQAYVPLRESSVFDWFADNVGALLGGVLSTLVLRTKD